MRNVFDQYTQPENRITHALLASLNEDRRLLREFLARFVHDENSPKALDISILEQTIPGAPVVSEDEAGRRGIPDAWIFDSKGWCVIVESKVLSPITPDQINRHIRTAKSRGFENVSVLIITIRKTDQKLPENAITIEWREVYSWLLERRHDSEWAYKASRYFEIAEARMVEADQLKEGTLTRFSGIPFTNDNPFDYLDAKRVMKLALQELRKRKDLRSLGMDPALSGRSAITGKAADRVWDFLQLGVASDAGAFTEFPHLTLGITRHSLEAVVTVPNSVSSSFRTRLKVLEKSGFRKLTKHILENMVPLLNFDPTATPYLRGIQRRYPNQRAIPFIDAQIEFDIRTAFDDSAPVKHQPQWLDLVYEVFTNKNSNFQIQIGAAFDYQRSSMVHTENALDCIAKSWTACAPLIKLAQS